MEIESERHGGYLMAKKNIDITKASAEVKKILADLDVDIIGIASMENLKGTRLEEQVKKLLPETNSVIVLAMEILPEILNLTSPERIKGAASTNDIMEGQAEYINGKLTWAANDIARASKKAGLKALPIPAGNYPYDARFLNADISFPLAAEAAGLGQIGFNGLVVTGKYGPRIRLTICLTEAKLEPTAKGSERFCRSCNVCIAKCPSKALDYPEQGEVYRINKYACSTYLTEAGGCWECVKQCPVASPQYD
jgi:epoxyqueuosine reductase QueG